MSTEVETGASSASDTAQHGTRAPWQRPVLRVLPADEAETGVNSTTDATVTFS